MQYTYAKRHMKAHSDVLSMLPEAINRLAPSKQSGIQVAKIEFGKVIGKATCVETTASDTIVYMKRRGRQHASRMVLNRQPEDATSVTLVFLNQGDNVHVISAWFGSPAPREPHDPSLYGEALVESQQFWATHALIAESQ